MTATTTTTTASSAAATPTTTAPAGTPATSSPTPATGSPSTSSPELVMVDPAGLLVDANLRVSVELDQPFVASIAEHGVMVPIVAVRTPAGQLQVRYGNRRTLAAVKAAHPAVPVVVVSEADADDAAGRIVRQWEENERRAGLSTADKVHATEQLAAFGLSAGDIAQRTRTALPDIEHALAVAGSKLAKRSAERHTLTLAQAATLGEFERDKKVTTELLAAAKKDPGVFEHVAQRARDARAEAEQRAALLATLKKAGVRVIAQPGYDDRRTKALSELKGSEPGKGMTDKEHAGCPGHAAYLARSWGQSKLHTVYACDNWRKQGHRDRYSTRPAAQAPTDEAARQAASAERRAVIENNKAWTSAEAVRRRWLTTFLARKSPPKGAAAFVAGELAHASHELGKALEHNGAGMLCQLLGVNTREALTAQAATATDARAQVLSLAFILAGYEARTNTDTWRNQGRGQARYFAFLAANGYTLADVEQLVIGKPTPAKTTPTKATPTKAAPAKATAAKATAAKSSPAKKPGGKPAKTAPPTKPARSATTRPLAAVVAADDAAGGPAAAAGGQADAAGDDERAAS